MKKGGHFKPETQPDLNTAVFRKGKDLEMGRESLSGAN